MSFVPAVNTARVTIKTLLHGQNVSTVMHVRKDTPWSAADLTALANEYIDWWNTDLAPNLGQGYMLETVAARDMSTADGLGVEVAAPAASGGDILNALMPGNVCLTIKHVTGFVGRNRQGRTKQGGLTENQQEGNAVTGAVRDAFVNAYEALRGRLVADDQELVVASFYDGTALVPLPNGETRKRPVPRATALLTPVLTFTADTALDSQRTRLNGRGT